MNQSLDLSKVTGSVQRRAIAALTCAFLFLSGAVVAQDAATAIPVERLAGLIAEVRSGEDLAAIKRLQRIYGYYLDKGLWDDLAVLFTDDAIAHYPAGTYVGRDSIRRHLFLNVGGGQMGENGLRPGRLYNHMSLQPVVHLHSGGDTATGRWRALAMFGSLGGAATWAEGIYEIGYRKVDDVWKIDTLDYHPGFAAPYDVGWGAAGGGGGGRPPLPHPPDRVRDARCPGFPEACIAPFHYANPGSLEGGAVWPVSGAAAAGVADIPDDVTARADLVGDLLGRAQRLRDEQAVENLIAIYGYYVDRRMWDHVADLFAEDATLEMELRGVYQGRDRIRAFLNLLGPEGLRDGDLNDRLQLQPVVHVSGDGQRGWARSRELAMTGVHGSHGQWSEGIYESTFVQRDGVWQFQSLRYYPTFITDYDQGWGRDAQPPAQVSTELPPDFPPRESYEIYPAQHIPPFHYRNPVTGQIASYPQAAGTTARESRAAALMPESALSGQIQMQVRPSADTAAMLAEAERVIARVRDHHALTNLGNAYGYYLDKNLWNDLADLFADDGSMELAQRGAYLGRERVREFLLTVFGDEGPVEGRLGNHLQLQPVIHIDPDGGYAEIRSRMVQQLNFGGRPSTGAAVYENEAVVENGVWKYRSVHAYNTWGADYQEGWARAQSRGVPGPSEVLPPDLPPTMRFAMFPDVYELPWHYANPVTGRPSGPAPLRHSTRATEGTMATENESSGDGDGQEPQVGSIPLRIATELLEIGPRIEAQRTAELYAPLHRVAPFPGVEVHRDLAYGRHERQVLDVFTAHGGGNRKPVLVFIHGGGFDRGAKSTEGSPFYDNVPLWAAENGFVGVNINYRLAPEFTWPSGIEDLTAVVRWLRSHIARYEGDPESIFLWGYSAGAAHAADYIAWHTRREQTAGIAGAILLSGFYDLGDEVSQWDAYYGDDVATYAERSSLTGLVRSRLPLLVVDAQLDPEYFQIEADRLTRQRAAAGRPVRRLHLPGHSHLSQGYAVGTADKSLTDPVSEFVRQNRNGQ